MQLLADRELLSLLPPLEKPVWSEYWLPALLGSGLVLFCVIGGLSLAYHMADFSSPALELWLAFAFAEAIIALVSLAGLLWGDPGVIHRSPETCLPVPDRIAQSLQSGTPVPTENIEDNNVAYCVRCFVWRRNCPTKKPTGLLGYCQSCLYGATPLQGDFHHCSRCKRCVSHFDHHCGVFGRCIAGKGLAGNMGFFKGMIGMAFMGLYTYVLGSVVRRIEGRPQGWEPELIDVLATLTGLPLKHLSWISLQLSLALGLRRSSSTISKEPHIVDPAHSLRIIVSGYIVAAIAILLIYHVVQRWDMICQMCRIRSKRIKMRLDSATDSTELTITSSKAA